MPTSYITAPRDAAPELARLLVEERLAACVNVLECESTYRWEDEIHEESEAVLLAKTTEEAYARLEERVVEAHPYDVPCVERFDEADERGEIHTHVQLLDGTHHGSFQHDDPALFFPSLEAA